MVWLAGVDGCRKGWFRASRETESGELHFEIVEKTSELIVVPPVPRVLAIVANDDILDAIAGLWTAHRIWDGNAQTLPETPGRDSIGFPMEMVS